MRSVAGSFLLDIGRTALTLPVMTLGIQHNNVFTRDYQKRIFNVKTLHQFSVCLFYCKPLAKHDKASEYNNVSVCAADDRSV